MTLINPLTGYKIQKGGATHYSLLNMGIAPILSHPRTGQKGGAKRIIRRRAKSPVDIALSAVKEDIEEMRKEKLENIEQPDELYLFTIYLPPTVDLSRFSKDFEEDEDVLSVVSLTEPEIPRQRVSQLKLEIPNKPYLVNNSVPLTRRELITILQKLFVNEDIEIEDYEQIPPMLNNSEAYVDNFITEAETQAKNRWIDENVFDTNESIIDFYVSKDILKDFPALDKLVEQSIKDAYYDFEVIFDNDQYFITYNDINKLRVSREQLISLLGNILKSGGQIGPHTYLVQYDPDTNKYSLESDDVYTISYDQALDLITKTIDLYTPKKRRELASSDDIMDEDEELIQSMKKNRI